MPWIIVTAYILDLIFGDPRWIPHPVKAIGWLAQKLEASLRRGLKNQMLGGIIFTAIILGLSWGITFYLITKITFLNQSLGFLVSVFFIYASLSIKDLKVESMKVCQALESEDLVSSRKNLSLIVGRDTQNLDEKEVVRATVETVAESTVDGILSPMFYAFLGGAPLAIAYKAVSTLDSLVGYKNEKYRDFGWASARLDDIANFIPARLSLIFVSWGSFIAGFDGFRALRVGLRDGRKNPSPNSGIPEAVFAGALGIQLGGLNYYNAVASPKPFIGDALYPLEIAHIRQSLKITYCSSGLFVLTTAGLFWLMGNR